MSSPMTPPPTPEYAQPGPKPEKPWYRRWWVYALGVLVALTLIGSLAPDEEPAKVGATSVSASESPSASPSKTAKQLRAGRDAAAARAAAKAKKDRAKIQAEIRRRAHAEAIRLVRQRQVAAAKAKAAKAQARAARKETARKRAAARKPVLDQAAVDACNVLGNGFQDVTTKQDRSDLARAFNYFARSSSEAKIVDAGQMLTAEVDSWTGFMWDGAVANAADICVKGGAGN